MSETKEVAGLVELLLARIGSEFDGEAHLSENEARAIATTLEALEAKAREIDALVSGERAVLPRTVEHAEALYTVSVACLKSFGRDPEAAREIERLTAEREIIRTAHKKLGEWWSAAEARAETAEATVSTLTRQLEEAREECAKIAETVVDTKDDGIDAFDASQIIAAAIRSLKQGERDA